MKTSHFTTIAALALANSICAAPVASPETAISSTEAHQLFTRAQCSTNNRCTKTQTDEIINYFVGRGTDEISVTSTETTIYYVNFESDFCYVRARAVNANTAASYARDVGYGVRNIVNACSSWLGAEGTGTAGGNGYFEITISSEY